ncbi:MAG: hydantoinase/oxoprolinase N-terminal domain-containing protein, partial [Myxococcota bacterium]
MDTGGTFTDCLAVDPSGAWHRAKVLSTGALRGRVAQRRGPRQFAIEQNWNAPEDFPRGWEFMTLGRAEGSIVDRFDASTSALTLDRDIELESGSLFEVVSREPAPVVAARLVTQTPAGAPLPPLTMRLGTTRATNALLERRGAPTALFITHGFGDLMLIGDQQRPDLFALRVVKPPPLYELAIEVDERLTADGTVLMPLQPETALEAARAALQRGITVAAIALMHSYRNPAHELALAAALRDLGFTHVSCSSQIAPLIRIVPRAATAIVNAYLA